MTEAAKDEAELIGTIAWAISGLNGSLNGSADGAAKAFLADMRAIGWTVVPQAEFDALRAENARLRAAIHLNTDLNAVRAVLKGQL